MIRRLQKSSSIEEMLSYRNQLSAAGVQSMVPFVQNANKLRLLNPHENNLRSEGFSVLFRALRDSPIERLCCKNCGIASIEIDSSEHILLHLKYLLLEGNIINTDGCRELAKLLQGGDATLERLHLDGNNIDDEGVAILASALQSNTSLSTSYLEGDKISKQGKIMLLKLGNDIASITATFQSNHTEIYVKVRMGNKIQRLINVATQINSRHKGNPEAAGREKVIQTQ